MANIVFCFPPITSTINSSLRLARLLKNGGHRVSYIGIPDCESNVRANGFDFFSVYEKWFPKGWFDDCFVKSQSSPEHTIKRNIAGNFNDFLNYIINGGDSDLSLILKDIKPDIVLISTSGIDSVVWALLMHKMDYKSVYVFDILGGVVNHTAPPVHSGLISNGSLWSSLKTLWVWCDFYVKKIKIQKFLTKNGFAIFSNKQILGLADYCRYPSEDISFFNDMSGPLLKLPELVLFPKRFDFPGVRKAGRYYAEAAIDLDREQASFPWEKVDESQPIVYAALGTLPLLAKADYENFFRIVIDASLKWPAWNWVLSIGNNLTVDDFKSVPANVIIVNRAPQLELLKKASLMITHGGPNSVKECIFFGVPMIVFPLWFDQPGNVARVTYHGLGLKGDFKTITAEALQGLVEEATVNPEFSERTKAMQKYFIETEQAKPSLQLIERFIRQANMPPFLD